MRPILIEYVNLWYRVISTRQVCRLKHSSKCNDLRKINVNPLSVFAPLDTVHPAIQATCQMQNSGFRIVLEEIRRPWFEMARLKSDARHLIRCHSHLSDMEVKPLQYVFSLWIAENGSRGREVIGSDNHSNEEGLRNAIEINLCFLGYQIMLTRRQNIDTLVVTQIIICLYSYCCLRYNIFLTL